MINGYPVRIPLHVAIIMDGNGRWAQQRGLPRTMGHRKGVEAVREIVRVAGDAGISYLTLFRIKRWSECQTCRICQKACEWGAIEGPRILVTECVRCDDCERLYASETKCPHWRILAYQQKKKVIPLTAVP